MGEKQNFVFVSLSARGGTVSSCFETDHMLIRWQKWSSSCHVSIYETRPAANASRHWPAPLYPTVKISCSIQARQIEYKPWIWVVFLELERPPSVIIDLLRNQAQKQIIQPGNDGCCDFGFEIIFHTRHDAGLLSTDFDLSQKQNLNFLTFSLILIRSSWILQRLFWKARVCNSTETVSQSWEIGDANQENLMKNCKKLMHIECVLLCHQIIFQLPLELDLLIEWISFKEDQRVKIIRTMNRKLTCVFKICMLDNVQNIAAQYEESSSKTATFRNNS